MVQGGEGCDNGDGEMIDGASATICTGKIF